MAVFNGLAEAYLAITERDPLKKQANLNKAERACHAARAHARKFLPAMPEALRLQGTCEWLNSQEAPARKWWDQSLKMAQEQGQRYDEGIILLEIGSRLNDRDYLERAFTILSEIGAEWDLARAREALEKL